MKNLKIIYAPKELKVIKGELLDEFLYDLDNAFEIYESDISDEKNMQVRSAFVLGKFDQLSELIKSFEDDPTAIYYKNLIKNMHDPAEKIYKNNPYSLEDADSTYIWFLFDLGRMKLFMDKNEDAKKLLTWGFKESFKGHEDYLASLRLLSIAFENSGDVEGAFFFLKKYLSFRAEAVPYLSEKLEQLVMKFLRQKGLNVEMTKHLIESFEILGPEYGENLKTLIKNNLQKLQEVLPDMASRYQKVNESFELSPVFDSQAVLTDIYDFLESRQLLPV
jgi:hypothetical protein